MTALVSSLKTDLKNLISKSAVYGLGSILLRALQFFLLPLYTRCLSPADYGILAVANLLSTVLSILLPLSLHGALNPVYFFSKTEKERQIGLGTIWTTLVILAGGITFLLDWGGPGLFPWLFRQVPFTPYLRLAVWAAFGSVLSLVPLNLLQMQERARQYVTFTITGALVQIGLIIYFVVYLKMGAVGYLLGLLLSGGLMAIPYLGQTFHQLRPAFNGRVLQEALAYSLPLVPHSLAAWVLELSDRLILEHWVSLDELGLYSLGYTYGAIMNMLAYAINSAWVPFLFKTDAQEGDQARPKLARLITYFTLVLCGAALGLSLFAREIIQFMTTPGFHPALRVAPWIVAGCLFSGLYYFPINLLFLKKKTGWVPVVTGLAGLLNVGLNLGWVPVYGILAAAWATLISYVVMLGLAWWLGQRVYPLDYEYGRLLKLGGVTLVLWLLGPLVPAWPLGWSLLVKSGIMLLFPLGLLGLRFVLPAEMRQLQVFLTALSGKVRLLLHR